MKEQVTNLGFRIRIYRSHEKCRRAVEREPQCMATSVFVASAPDAEPLVAFLTSQGPAMAGGVWFVIDASSASPAAMARLQQLPMLFPEGSQVVLARAWEEIIATLGAFGAEAIASGVAVQTGSYGAHGNGGCGEGGVANCDGEDTEVAYGEHANGEAPKGIAAWKQRLGLTDSPPGPLQEQRDQVLAPAPWRDQYLARPPRDPLPRASDAPSQGGDQQPAIPRSAVRAADAWTLVWIADNAFKPASSWQRVELEGLGCQLKGYKCQKNAARALDKKRAIGRCVVLVSFTEASAMAAYLQLRQDLGALKIVIEAREADKEGKGLEKLEGVVKMFVQGGYPAEVSHNFPEAVAAIRKMVVDAGWPSAPAEAPLATPGP